MTRRHKRDHRGQKHCPSSEKEGHEAIGTTQMWRPMMRSCFHKMCEWVD